jgi:hypothetical protein
MKVVALAAALGLCASVAGPCLAQGTVRVQQSDGTSQVYRNVNIKVVHQTLRIESADDKGTLVVNQATCAYQGELERCTPSRVSLQQGASTRPINIKSGSIYLNPTNHTVTMPLSTTQLPPHSILLTIRTKIDTYISMSGQIDGLVR